MTTPPPPGPAELRPADNQCGACRQTFGTLEQFDRHQTWDYTQPHHHQLTCTNPAELGLVQDARGVWQTPAGLANRQHYAERLRPRRGAATPNTP